MINFNKIEIKNFLSIGNQPLTIDFKKGLHYVTGRDSSTGSRNGVGKTAIFVDAVLFALYGKVARKAKIPDLINGTNKRGLKVTLEFDIDGRPYTIERGVWPSFLILHNPDGTKLELSAKKETQEIVTEIIKIDFNTCRNMLVMSINGSKHFMEMRKFEKRMFIEQILNIDVIGTMFKIISTQHNELKGDLKNLEGQHTVLKKHYEETVEQNKKIAAEVEQFEDKKKVQVKELVSEIKKIEIQRDRIANVEAIDESESHKTINDFRTKEQQLREKITKLETVVSYNKKNIKASEAKLEALNESVCFECDSEITDEHRNKRIPELREAIDQLIDESNEMAAKVVDFKVLLTLAVAKISKLEKKVQKAVGVRNDIKSLTEQIALKRNHLKGVKNSSVNISMIDISKMKKDYDKIYKDLIKTSDDFKYAKLLRSIFSDEGIKSYIVRQVLPLLNSKLNHYLKLLGSNYFLEFDDTFNEIVKSSSGRKLLPYDNFSAGEQKRVDLALLMTFIDIARMQGRSTTNLLILDEVTDSSLDSDGLEQFIDIISDKSKQEDIAVYVISHRKDYNSDLYSSIIVLEKDQGFTRVKHIFDGG